MPVSKSIVESQSSSFLAFSILAQVCIMSDLLKGWFSMTAFLPSRHSNVSINFSLMKIDVE